MYSSTVVPWPEYPCEADKGETRVRAWYPEFAWNQNDTEYAEVLLRVYGVDDDTRALVNKYDPERVGPTVVDDCAEPPVFMPRTPLPKLPPAAFVVPLSMGR